MDIYDETFKSWNNVASLYEDKFMHLDIYDKSYDLICDLIKIGGYVLDVGCGPGNITRYLLSRRPDLEIHGIDIAPNMIARARKNNPLASFAVMDCREIGQLNKTFDAIICGFCLPYLSQQESSKFISDASHLLTDNGYLYISFVAGAPINSGFQVGSSGDRVYFYYHELDSLFYNLHDNGFDTPTLLNVNYEKEHKVEVHTILIAAKQ